VELARHAESVGADAIGAIPPYYYRYPQDALLDHYRTLIKSVRIPVFLQQPGGFGEPHHTRDPPDPGRGRIGRSEGLCL
jgi:dihydrodipicolinate synthase/N-acetylneuraminate lyase